MKTLTGILLDVSGSMRQNAGVEIEEENCELARTTIEVIDNFLKYDVSRNNLIFALGVGAKYGKGIFNVLKTIERFDGHDEFIEHVFNRFELLNTVTVPRLEFWNAQSVAIALPWIKPPPYTDTQYMTTRLRLERDVTIPDKASFDDLIECFFLYLLKTRVHHEHGHGRAKKQ